MEKLHIEKNTTQETLVIPLYARKLCTERFPSLFTDYKAIELMDRLDYDFSSIENQSKGLVQSFGALEVAMRQTDLKIEVLNYLKNYPNASVVNLGCGLDQTAESCDNGTCKIYNIDMPDVIEIRNQLIPQGERVQNIAADINDTKWFDLIDSTNGVIFFAAGVFYYFTTEQMQKLINEMAIRFKNGKLVFDTAGKQALKMMLKTFIKQAGIKNVGAYFHVDSIEKDVAPWIKNANVSSKGYMLGYNDLKDDCVPSSFRMLAKIGDNFMKMQIICFDFNCNT